MPAVPGTYLPRNQLFPSGLPTAFVGLNFDLRPDA
jgi:hypothetical protein